MAHRNIGGTFGKSRWFSRRETARHGASRRALRVEALEVRALLSVAPMIGSMELVAANHDGPVTPVGDSVETGTRQLLLDGFQGTWSDAEKDATSTEDDLLCWAATAISRGSRRRSMPLEA